jgi:hypothetical protein
MFVCQWHLDIPYGKQGDASGMSAPQFRAHSDALAPYIVPGSQYWVVYRVIEEARPGRGSS